MKDNAEKRNRGILSSLEKLIQVQRILLWDTAKKENLSPIQIQFLIYLNKYSDERRRVSAIAEEFDLTKATVSDAVSNLVEKGLVQKDKLQEDKRAFILNLTSYGKVLVKKIDTWQEKLYENINNIPDENKEAAYQFLIELLKSLFDDGTINIARMCLTCGNVELDSKGLRNECSLTGRIFSINDVNLDCNNYKLIKKNN